MVRALRVNLTEERDLPLLLFLWKWKLATTAALANKFFPNRSPITAHKRLWQLEKGGHIRARSLDGGGRDFAWMLDRKGYAAIRDCLPALRSDGYKAEHLSHDLVATAFHLGDWFWGVPEGVRLFSEQQLWRYEVEFYPRGVPKSELHRPDGWILLGHPPGANQPRLVALEVELTPKKRSDYELVADFYESQKVQDVFWLTARPGLANRIHNILRRYQNGLETAHSFACFGSFVESGWAATFQSGKRIGETIRNSLSTLVNSTELSHAGNNTETSPHIVSTKFLLDTRKAPHRSKSCRNFEPAPILE